MDQGSPLFASSISARGCAYASAIRVVGPTRREPFHKTPVNPELTASLFPSASPFPSVPVPVQN